jgi:putative transposase
VDVPEGTPIVPKEFIGVDFGVVNLTTDNEGDVYTNTETEKIRQLGSTLHQYLSPF